jgi:hypothetical protein
MRTTTRPDSCVETEALFRSHAGYPATERTFGEFLQMICKLRIGVGTLSLAANPSTAAAEPAQDAVAMPGASAPYHTIGPREALFVPASGLRLIGEAS